MGCRVAGVPVGQEMADELMPIAGTEETVAREGSIIIVVATDAPLLPHQLTRLVSNEHTITLHQT